MKRWPLFLLILALCACQSEADVYQGYAEGEFVYMGSSQAGRLERLLVASGDEVAAGAPLFTLESGLEQAAFTQAEKELEAAEGSLADLKQSLRAPELSAIEAQIDQARAVLENSRVQFTRAKALYANKSIPKSQYDNARTTMEADEANLHRLESELALGRDSVGRQEQIAAQSARVASANAALAQARWRLDEKNVAAPTDGRVFDLIAREGEYLAASKPVLSFLPPENIKAKFFIPEGELSGFRVGERVFINCDGCPAPIEARITYVSPQAEYTPPVIYSDERRNKLVFMLEARPAPADAVKLHPGQPLLVSPVRP